MTATESSHWYTTKGEPMHYVPRADGGGDRATTLRDAKKLNLVPSVTGVLGIVYKYGLVRWQIEQGVRCAYNFPAQDLSENEYAAAVMKYMDETAPQRTGSEVGTAIHQAIAAWADNRPYPEEYEPHVEAAVSAMEEMFPGVTDWRSEVAFAHPLGYGGAVDMHSPSTGAVVDFKTKDGPLKGRLAYDQNCQLAAYHRGLDLMASGCASVFISRTDPGVAVAHEWSLNELARGWDVFQHALGLWILTKGYDPGFERDHENTV